MSGNGFLFLLAAGYLFAILLAVWWLAVSLRGLFRPRPEEDRRSRAWDVVKCCLAFSLLAALLYPQFLPATCSVREAPRRDSCTNRLSQFAKALLNYESIHGRFPPAYSVDKDGRPLHSWRVLILPYLEQEALYKQIRLDEPWDSPHNKAVFDAAPIPRVFACPSETRERGEESEKETCYVMIVGPGTISDGPNAVRMEDITDGISNTIAIVEMSDSGIHWAEPRDLKADEMSYRINDPDHPCIRSRHKNSANVAFCDGSVLTVKDEVPPELVKALTTIAGGEAVGEFWRKY